MRVLNLLITHIIQNCALLTQSIYPHGTNIRKTNLYTFQNKPITQGGGG
jgi:hypothetical protein